MHPEPWIDETGPGYPFVNQRLTNMDLEMFRGVVPFVAVAQEKSFRKAAAQLGVSPAAVSKAIQSLEERIGLPLLVRSTRAVTLTREGELLFPRCQEAVAAVSGAREAIEPLRSLPAGELTVSVPFVGASLLAPALALLRSRYPRLDFRVLVTDRLSKLAEESVDIAVRVGPLAESSLIARRLRRTRLFTVASPAYLARRGGLRRVADLDQHDCLSLVAPNGRPHPWLFASGPRPVRAALIIDHGPSLVDAALAGLGVTQLFDYMAEGLVREGKLVAVLGDEVADGPDVHAVCAPGRRAAARIRAAFEAFADAFAPSPR
jgi:LysR family transcriptional regulator, regulator for bpeEF and oprC